MARSTYSSFRRWVQHRVQFSRLARFKMKDATNESISLNPSKVTTAIFMHTVWLGVLERLVMVGPLPAQSNASVSIQFSVRVGGGRRSGRCRSQGGSGALKLGCFEVVRMWPGSLIRCWCHICCRCVVFSMVAVPNRDSCQERRTNRTRIPGQPPGTQRRDTSNRKGDR
jgi:hypothetical protein